MGSVLSGSLGWFRNITSFEDGIDVNYCRTDDGIHNVFEGSSLYFGGQFINQVYDNKCPTQDMTSLKNLINLNSIISERVVSSNINIKKSTLRITKRNEPNAYDISFYFDAISPCAIQILYFATEIYDGKTLIFECEEGRKRVILPGYLNASNYLDASHFTAGLNQYFKTDKSNALFLDKYQNLADFCGSDNLNLDDLCLVIDHNSNKLDQIVNELEFDKYNTNSANENSNSEENGATKETNLDSESSEDEDLSRSEMTRSNLKPIIIIIESLPSLDALNNGYSNTDIIDFTNNKVSTQINFVNLMKFLDNLELHVSKQKIIVNRILYKSYDIYGLERQPETAKENAIDGKYQKRAECVICLTKEIEILITLCRHLCICEECVDEFYFKSENCPICRHEINSLIKLETLVEDFEVSLI